MLRKIPRVFIFCSLLLAGCNIDSKDLIRAVIKFEDISFDTLGAEAGRGAVHGLKDSLLSTDSKIRLDTLLRSLGANIVLGLQDSLLPPATKRHLDTVITGLLVSLNKSENLRSLDSLLQNLGDSLTAQVDLLLNDALGIKTGQHLRELLYGSILGDSTFNTLGRLRDTLVGSQLQGPLTAIVTKLIDTLTWGMKNMIGRS